MPPLPSKAAERTRPSEAQISRRARKLRELRQAQAQELLGILAAFQEIGVRVDAGSGLSNADVAAIMKVSEGTVSYLKGLLRADGKVVCRRYGPGPVGYTVTEPYASSIVTEALCAKRDEWVEVVRYARWDREFPEDALLGEPYSDCARLEFIAGLLDAPEDARWRVRVRHRRMADKIDPVDPSRFFEWNEILCEDELTARELLAYVATCSHDMQPVEEDGALELREPRLYYSVIKRMRRRTQANH